MKTIKYYILILLIGVGITSCQSEKEDEGYLFTDPTAGALYLIAPDVNEDIPMIVTRSADFTMLDKKNFIIEIQGIGSSNSSTFRRFETYTALEQEGMPLELPVGSYSVKAFSYDSVAVLREQPYFFGETTLTIEAHEVSSVVVECKYKSLGVEFQLTDNFRKFFNDDYTITVQQDMDGASAIYSSNNTGRIYFTSNCDYFLKVIVEATSRDNEKHPVLTYYFNQNAEDPQFNGDAPHKGEYFIITVDSEIVTATSFMAQ